MAIHLKSSREIEAMRAAGRIVAQAFDMLAGAVQPGVSLRDLDRQVSDFLGSRGAEPLYKGYTGRRAGHPPFPGVICASVNEEICHGLPDERVLKSGDIVGIDIGLKYDGWCGDACVTYPVGETSDEARRLLSVTRQALQHGIDCARVGGYLSDIGAAIEAHAESHGFSVVYEWTGHGIGRGLHEDPTVSHRGPAGHGPRLRPGMVFTIEPMLNAGRSEWRLLRDGWTVVTRDGSLSAQFEHTIAITPDGPQVLSAL
jgi:methionyl aminopeptidase